MAIGSLDSTSGILSLIFSEAAMTVLFHGTYVGPAMLAALGLTPSM